MRCNAYIIQDKDFDAPIFLINTLKELSREYTNMTFIIGSSNDAFMRLVGSAGLDWVILDGSRDFADQVDEVYHFRYSDASTDNLLDNLFSNMGLDFYTIAFDRDADNHYYKQLLVPDGDWGADI